MSGFLVFALFFFALDTNRCSFGRALNSLPGYTLQWHSDGIGRIEMKRDFENREHYQRIDAVMISIFSTVQSPPSIPVSLSCTHLLTLVIVSTTLASGTRLFDD